VHEVRVLVTGARGKVGRHAVSALQRAGHEVTATDLAAPEYERGLPGEPAYLQGDVTDAGVAYALVRGHDAVVHAAAIPDPLHHAPHVVLQNNLMGAFNIVEACVVHEVPRLVNVSSETVPGVIFAGGDVMPPYLPIDEDTPAGARDHYGFGKETIERWCDRTVLRAPGLSVVSVRPSWVAWHGNYERNLGPLVREPYQDSLNFWAYTDAHDLGEAVRLACEVELAGHEVVYVAQPDNCTGEPLADLVGAVYPDAGIELRPTDRDDASGIDVSKAQRLLGWTPTRTWRDYLDDEGRLRQDAPTD
jgi:UDP-glucose 4-epimerase